MQGMTGTGTVRANRTEKTPLKVVEEMKKYSEDHMMLLLTPNRM